MRSGVVLAGGAGRRMGAYKPLVPFRGRALVTYPLDALAPLCEEILVAHGTVLDPALERALAGRARLVPDEGTGPVAGLLAAAQAARGEWLLVAPCDAPFLTSEVYAELLQAVGQRDGACASHDGVPDPLVSALRRDKVLVAAKATLWTGGRSARDLLSRLEVTVVPGAAHDLWDIDTPADRERAERAGGARP